MPTTRKTKPASIRDMARRRGLVINKAVNGGWYVILLTAPGNLSPVLYCSHLWSKVKQFVKKQPIMVLRREIEEEE